MQKTIYVKPGMVKKVQEVEKTFGSFSKFVDIMVDGWNEPQRVVFYGDTEEVFNKVLNWMLETFHDCKHMAEDCEDCQALRQKVYDLRVAALKALAAH